MNLPTISVVMAAYNGTALIGETIASLVGQTFTDWELVVVDDCSADGTLALLHGLRDPRIRVIAAEQNRGPVHARNRAFEQARGRYIAGLDQDDLCRPGRFAAQVAYLDANPGTVLVGTAAAELHGRRVVAGRIAPVTTPALIGWLLLIQNPIVWSSTMFRADAARKLGTMTRPEAVYAEDFDLYHRLATLGSIARIDDELVIYRSHSGGISKLNAARMIENAAAVLVPHYAALFGDDAQANAEIVSRYVMARQPVADGAMLNRVGDVVATLQADHVARTAPDAEDLALIRWETARIWARIGQAGLRSGAVGIGDTIRARRDHLGLGYAGIDTLIPARLIGGMRAARRR